MYHQYALDVQSGKIPVCEQMEKTIARYFSDLERDDIYFDHDEAERVLKFCGFITHHKGALAGQPFKVEPWEAFILCSVICWKWKATGLRRFKEALVFIPRKNGKTFLSSVVANYFLMCDPKQQDISCYAINAQQARLAFDGAKKMVSHNKVLKKRASIWAHKLEHKKTNSIFEPVNAKAGSQEGRNDSIMICDELHTHPDSSMFDVMTLGAASRQESTHFIITTAGTDTTSFCKQFYEQCKTIEADTTFTAIFELDDESEIETPDKWIKANPNLGVSVFESEITDTLEKARNIPHRYSEVLTKRFNLWRNGEQEFISEKDWKKLNTPDDKPSRETPTYIGIDLSSASDITAVWCVQSTGEVGQVRVWGKCYLPQSALERGKKNSEIYQQWVRQGWLEIAGDRVIDYEKVENGILELCDTFNVESVSFDPWNSNFLITRLESQGIETEKVRQGFVSLSPPTKALQVAVIQEKVIHDNNPILNWAIGNVSLSEDAAGNIKPDKKKSQNKIDPVAAMLCGYRTWMLEQEQGEISEEVATFTW